MPDELIETQEVVEPQESGLNADDGGGDNPDDQVSELASNGLPFALNGEGKSLGYPVNTSVKDMDPVEQAAYWKVQSRTWESRAKKKPELESNDEVERLQAEIEQLRDSQLSEEQRTAQAAIEEAVEAARAETAAHYKGLLNQEQLTGYARHYLKTDEKVAEWLPTINKDFFLGEDGNVDVEKVQSHFSVFGTSEQQQDPAPRTPEWVNAGQGRPGAKPKPSPTAEAAAALAKRFPDHFQK